MGGTDYAGAGSFEIEERASLQTGEGEEIPSIHLPWQVLGLLCWTPTPSLQDTVLVQCRCQPTQGDQEVLQHRDVQHPRHRRHHTVSTHRLCPYSIAPLTAACCPRFCSCSDINVPGHKGKGGGGEGSRRKNPVAGCNTDTMHHEEQRALQRLHTRCRSCDTKTLTEYCM
jgi:hypothetical protein